MARLSWARIDPPRLGYGFRWTGLYDGRVAETQMFGECDE